MKIHIYLIALLFTFFPSVNVSAVTTVHQDSYNTTTSIFSKSNENEKLKPKKRRRRKKSTSSLAKTAKVFRTIFFTTSSATLLGLIMYIGGFLVAAFGQNEIGLVFAFIGIVLALLSAILSLIFGVLWVAFWISSENE